MSGDQYSTRLDGTDRRKLERYRDEHNVSKSEALRHGVRQLEQDKRSNTGPDEPGLDDLRDRLVSLLRNWGVILGTSITVLILSNSGILPNIVELVAGIILLPLLAYSWLVS